MFAPRQIRLALTLLALTIAVAPAVFAQGKRRTLPRREGFWWSAGLGYGSQGCENCSDREGGFSGGLSAGGTLSQRVLLGVGTTGYQKSEGGSTFSVGTLDARVRFYPSARGRFFLTGGLGIGSLRSTNVGRSGTFSAYGNGAVLGVGADVPVSRRASATPYFNLVGVRADGSSVNFWQLGAAITFH
jgi:hypothetical protein